MIKWQVESYYSARGNHDVVMTWDTKYSDGKISEVYACSENQYLIDFRIVANFCKHYFMQNGTLAYILTQYENVST